LAGDRIPSEFDTLNVAAAYFPSGHATAAFSLALAATLVAPGRWRLRVAALGLLFAVTVSFALLIGGDHFPSDVLASYLLATGSCLVLLAALRAASNGASLLGPRASCRAGARGRADRALRTRPARRHRRGGEGVELTLRGSDRATVSAWRAS
jgi:membrane-associated phospholipid phosphatase